MIDDDFQEELNRRVERVVEDRHELQRYLPTEALPDEDKRLDEEQRSLLHRMIASELATERRLDSSRDVGDPDDFFVRALPERYTFESLLGHGAQGISYRASDTSSERDVVVKKLALPDATDRIDRMLRRLRDQLDSIDVPAFPELHDPIEIEGFAPEGRTPSRALVRAYVPGRDLASELEAEGAFEPEEIVEVLGELFDVLDHTHDKFPRLIHGNLKLSNLVRRPIGTLAVVDLETVFRCASELDPSVASTLEFGYAPPELFEGERLPATDLYQVGVCTLHLSTGRHPAELPRRAGTLDWSAIEEVPEAFDELFSGLLAARPKDRFETVDAARGALPDLETSGSADAVVSSGAELSARKSGSVDEEEFQQMMAPGADEADGNDTDEGALSARDADSVDEEEFQRLMEPDADEDAPKRRSISEDTFHQRMEPDEAEETDEEHGLDEAFDDGDTESVDETVFQQLMEPNESEDTAEDGDGLGPRERQLSEEEVQRRIEQFEAATSEDDSDAERALDSPEREAIRSQLEDELERAAKREREREETDEALEARTLEADEASEQLQNRLERDFEEAARREREERKQQRRSDSPPGSSSIDALDVGDLEETDDESELEARRTNYDLGPSEDAVQEVVRDRYEIVHDIGEGEQSVTQLAWDRRRFEHVAVKTLDLSRVSDWDAIEGLEREWELLSTLDHPAIPEGIDYIEEELEDDTVERAMLVQEYVEGRDLGTMIDRGVRVSEREVKQFLGAALEVLGYLHELNPPVIHRNVQPGNLIRRKDGGLVLVDFGSVPSAEEQLEPADASLESGDPYTPVEQQIGQSEPASDIYALGVTMIHLLSHVDPMNLPRTEEGIQFEEILNLSDELERYFKKMTAREVEHRFKNAAEAIAALKAPEQLLEDDSSFLDSLGNLAFWSD